LISFFVGADLSQQRAEMESNMPDKNHIPRLPDEIILEILHMLVDETNTSSRGIHDTIIACMQTCQRWKELAAPFLWYVT
jgi:hypothetical protein